MIKIILITTTLLSFTTKNLNTAKIRNVNSQTLVQKINMNSFGETLSKNKYETV